MGTNVAVFIDGTRNRLSAGGGTNVHRLYKMAELHAGQSCLYLSGVGTRRVPGNELLRQRARLGKQYHPINTGPVGRFLGALAGYGTAARIKEAYAFIVANFGESKCRNACKCQGNTACRCAGNKLFLFGFSRGAFAARSLAGFLDKVGLLLEKHIDLVPAAYMLYRTGRGDKTLETALTRMLERNIALGERPVPVYFVGVWDTVGSLGLPPPFQKLAFQTDHHLTLEMPQNVTHGRHAMALHELRSMFAPVPWKKSAARADQSLEQVWFAGAHADIGGGYDDTSLSSTPLQWMAEEARGLGLVLEGSVPNALNIMADIHHEICGIFALCTPGRRALLGQLAEAPLEGPLAGHSVHWTAALRRDRFVGNRGTYPFRRALRTTLDDIDALTRRVIIRTVEHADAYPITDQQQLYGEHASTLKAALIDADLADPAQVRALADLIILATRAHGQSCLPGITASLQSAAEHDPAGPAARRVQAAKRALQASLPLLMAGRQLHGQVEKAILFLEIASNLSPNQPPQNRRQVF